MPMTTKNLIEICSTILKAGFGAIVGLVGGKGAPYDDRIEEDRRFVMSVAVAALTFAARLLNSLLRSGII